MENKVNVDELKKIVEMKYENKTKIRTNKIILDYLNFIDVKEIDVKKVIDWELLQQRADEYFVYPMESAEFMNDLLWSESNREEQEELMELITEKANSLDISAKLAFDYVQQGVLAFEVIIKKELPLVAKEYQKNIGEEFEEMEF